MHSCTESEPPKTQGRDENSDNCSLAQLNANSNTLPAQDDQSTATHEIKPDKDGDGLIGSLDNLHLSKDEEGRPIPETAGGAQEDGQPRTDSLFDDDQTHLSNSSTKPTSFDSKSMASVTTFAMDEKESLRPDDSASVQAVEEDEFLAPTTDVMNSQANSDPSTSNRGDSQQHKNALLRESELLKKSTLPFNEDALRRNGVLPAPEGEQVLHGFPSEPDEKLVEAMGSPKDRLLLLQLEEKIISFIKNSRPTPLTMLHPGNSNNPSANAPTMKIMRRMGQPGERGSAAGSTATSSAVPSKTASESGGDGTNDEDRNGGTSSTGATPSRDRASLTREEREAKYQEARERIFRDFPESKSTDTGSGEQSADVSRSSSRTGRKKVPKPRSPKDDGFEARSQFNAYYTSPQLPGGPAVYHNSAHHGAIPPQNYYVMAQNPPGGGMHHYPQQMSPSGHGPMYASSGGMNGFPPYSGPQTHSGQNNWQQSGGHQGYNQYPHHQAQVSPMMAQRSATVPSPRAPAYSAPNHSQYSQPTPGWTPTPFQPGYPPQIMARSPPVHWPNMPPNAMAAGQAPYNQGMGSPQPFIPSKPAHPAPGSFSRSRFSPQSRSLAPTSNSQAGYFGGDSPSSQYASPHFNNHPRSNSRDSKPGMNPSPPSHYFKSKGTPPNMVGQPQQQPTYGRQTDTQTHDSIAKWGTPSHLPPKPPPPETPYPSDATNSNRPVGVTSPPLASKLPPSETKTAPFVVSGASSSEKQPHGNASS
ncbi:hypothetical protein HL42_3464 [Trichophyton rubrum]|nr:hypothetical protein HL42_3464 [Trichophyton rubrum]